MKARIKAWLLAFAVLALALAFGAGMHRVGAARLPASLRPTAREPGARLDLFDRHGAPVARSYAGGLNTDDTLFLHEIPPFLRDAFIASEDRRFASHAGVDLAGKAGIAAAYAGGSGLRGGSTLSEQVVRLLTPRPRTLRAKLAEAFDALALERRFSKPEILEFYLNQVPFASNRRGVRQAARFYFRRDPDTLSQAEMLALTVLVRAPSRYDLRRASGMERFERSMRGVADSMARQGFLTAEQRKAIDFNNIQLADYRLDIEAPHFAAFARGRLDGRGSGRTSLDGALQAKTAALLRNRLKQLAKRYAVKNGAVLVADHATGEILAWASDDEAATRDIDGVRVLRQPGSLLKPFLYGLALEKGWTAATLIDDSPLSLPAGIAGSGVHRFKNYSNTHYGLVSVRSALGNSLNIPAVKAAEFVGVDAFLARLRSIGFSTLDRSGDFYGDGLALGNGEVSLYEVVRAYAMLASLGKYKDLTPWRAATGTRGEQAWQNHAAQPVPVLSSAGAVGGQDRLGEGEYNPPPWAGARTRGGQEPVGQHDGLSDTERAVAGAEGRQSWPLSADDQGARAVAGARGGPRLASGGLVETAERAVAGARGGAGAAPPCLAGQAGPDGEELRAGGGAFPRGQARAGGGPRLASGGLVETAERAAMGARGGQDRLDPRAAYIIGDILADPQAKAWEFNAAEMRFPVPTAIKTGTSSNHRDAWAVGYDSRFVAGVWLGNLDFAETDGLTGANGALRLLRSVLAEAGRNREGAPLARPSGIVEAKVCLTPACDAQRLEKFAEGTEPAAPQASQAPPVMRMVSPVSGQKIAIDPRVPRARQRLPLEAGGLAPGDRAVWSVDGRPVEGSSWPVAEGSHTVRLLVMRGGKAVYRERATVSVLPAGRQRP